MANSKLFPVPSTLNITLPVAGERVEFRWCPPGSFYMGSLGYEGLDGIDEKPQILVHLTQGFWVSTTLVTQQQWNRLIKSKETSSRYLHHPAWPTSWYGARDFCSITTSVLRETSVLADDEIIDLPSEAQWEYFCRAHTTTTWYFGNDETLLHEHSWFKENSNDRSQPIKLKKPNPWGIYDLYGNAAEWCLDDLRSYNRIENTVDPIFQRDPSILKIIRGGDFTSKSVECRSASRSTSGPVNQYNDPIGFRMIIKCLSIYGENREWNPGLTE